jgi:hypothetical protein
MKRLRIGRVRAVMIGLVAIALPATALAYWSAIGTGTTSVQLADPLAMTLSPGVLSDPISPGVVGGVSVIVSNPNTIEEHIGSFTLDSDGTAIPIVVDGGHGGCDVSALSFATQTNGGVGWVVPPKVGSADGTLAVELPDALAMSRTAANACQGATFTITLDVNP